MPKMILIDVHSACWKKLKSPHLILSKCVIFSQSINELFHDDMSEIAVQEISKCIQSILHSEGNQTKCTSLRNSITPSCLCHLTFINLGDLLSQRRVHGTNLFNVTFKLYSDVILSTIPQVVHSRHATHQLGHELCPTHRSDLQPS